MTEQTGAQGIDAIITLYGGWKAATLTDIRKAVLATEPSIEEAVKWRMKSRPEGLPVWSNNGIVCLAETFKDNIKLVFVKGAAMEQETTLFNARLNSKTDRAIELHDGDAIDADGISALIKRAIELNNTKS